MYGSQALGIQHRHSDIDLLVMVRPTKEQLFYHQLKGKEVTLDNNEKIVIFNLLTLHRGLNKMDIQEIEALYTPLYIHEEFEEEYQAILDYLDTQEANDRLYVTMYYIAYSYIKKYNNSQDKPFEFRKKLVAKLELYTSLFTSEGTKLTDYYKQHEVPQPIKNNYLSLIQTSVDENVLNTKIQTYQKILDGYLDNIKQYTFTNKETKEFKKATELIVDKTIRFMYNKINQ